MLKGLTLKFNVTGKGTEALKKIKQSYKEAEELLKDPLKIKIGSVVKNPFIKIEGYASGLITKGYSIAGAFKNAFLGIQRVGTTAFNKIVRSADRLLMRFRLTRSIKKGFQSFSAYSTRVFENAQKKANSLSGTIKRMMGALGAGLTIKTAFEGASNIEQYRNTLETVLKDPVAAQKKLAWGSRLANRTPFETEEIISGLTKMQSYGMEGDRVLKSTGKTYIEMIGDMASAMNKPFEQAVEALADSRTGELERLKEFGITKNMIGDFAKSQGYGEMFNNQGQIKDINLFNKALFELMNSKYGGAMEKQARTFKGAISTIKGVFKSGLSTIAGMDEFGNVIENSPFQIVRDKVLIPLADLLVKWQENGTFTRWAEKLAEGMKKVISIGSKIISFCIKWKEVLIPITSALAGLFVINKIAYMVGALKIALAGLNFNPVILGVGLAITAGVALYRNWDKITKVFKGAFNVFVGVLRGIKDGIKDLFSKFSEYSGIFNFLIPGKIIFDGLSAFWGAWDNKLGIIENVKNAFAAFFTSLKESIQTAIDGFKKLGEKISNFSLVKKVKGFFSFGEEPGEEKPDGSHRTGLSYVPHDNYIAKLHEGERVLTKKENEDYSKVRTKSGNVYNLNFNINNSSEVDWNKIGELIVSKIKKFEEEREIAEGLI